LSKAFRENGTPTSGGPSMSDVNGETVFSFFLLFVALADHRAWLGPAAARRAGGVTL